MSLFAADYHINAHHNAHHNAWPRDTRKFCLDMQVMHKVCLASKFMSERSERHRARGLGLCIWYDDLAAMVIYSLPILNLFTPMQLQSSAVGCP